MYDKMVEMIEGEISHFKVKYEGTQDREVHGIVFGMTMALTIMEQVKNAHYEDCPEEALEEIIESFKPYIESENMIDVLEHVVAKIANEI